MQKHLAVNSLCKQTSKPERKWKMKLTCLIPQIPLVLYHAGPAHLLPSCLSAASPRGDGSCVCRDPTGWQGRAVTQPLSLGVLTAQTCVNAVQGWESRERRRWYTESWVSLQGEEGMAAWGLKRSQQLHAQKEDELCWSCRWLLWAMQFLAASAMQWPCVLVNYC